MVKTQWAKITIKKKNENGCSYSDIEIGCIKIVSCDELNKHWVEVDGFIHDGTKDECYQFYNALKRTARNMVMHSLGILTMTEEVG